MICMGNLNTITLAVKLHVLKHRFSSSVMTFIFNKEKTFTVSGVLILKIYVASKFIQF